MFAPYIISEKSVRIPMNACTEAADADRRGVNRDELFFATYNSEHGFRCFFHSLDFFFGTFFCIKTKESTDGFALL